MDGECMARGVDLLAMPGDRFLNVVYAAMVARLPADETGKTERPQLDNALGVAGWPTPGGARYVIKREPGAPSWWQGEEEASQSFLSSAGVVML